MNATNTWRRWLGSERVKGVAMTVQEVLERIQSELMDAMGPLASAVIEEKAAELGMTPDSVPSGKVPVLVEEASFEIQNQRRKLGFQRAALEILKELPVEVAVSPAEAETPDIPEGPGSPAVVRRRSRLRLAEDPRDRSRTIRSSGADNAADLTAPQRGKEKR